MFLPTLAAIVMLPDKCHGSDDNNNSNVTVTTTVLSASVVSSQWTAATAAYQVAVTSTPLQTADNGNDTAIMQQQLSAVGKPSKFDEHVEDWQYVDEPLKNVTAVGVLTAGNSTAAPSVACKMCSIVKTKRNKRNHDDRLLKMTNKKSSLRHRQLYAELVAAAASKQSYRRKRFRRSAVSAFDDAVSVPNPVNAESSTYKQLFRYKRYRRRSVAESTATEQSYRRKRFRRSVVAAYPNGMIRPYRSYQNGHQQQSSYPQSSSSLAADLQQQQNRRWRYRYATDPYHHKRNGAVTAWDRSVEFRRRYLRFPPTHDSPPPSFVNSNGNPWSPAISSLGPGLPPPQSQLSSQPFNYLSQYPLQQSPPAPPPPMGPRSPRLVFRDPVDQGTLQAPFGSANGLQDLLVSQPEDVKGQCWFTAVAGYDENRNIGVYRSSSSCSVHYCVLI